MISNPRSTHGVIGVDGSRLEDVCEFWVLRLPTRRKARGSSPPHSTEFTPEPSHNRNSYGFVISFVCFTSESKF